MRTSIGYSFGLFCITLSWLAFDHYRPWVNFHSELLALLGLLGLVLSVLARHRGALVLPRVSVVIAMVALLPWAQFVDGEVLFVGDAVLSSLYLSALLAAIVVGFTFARQETNPSQQGLLAVMHTLWVAAMISGAIGLAQWLNVQEPMGMYIVQTDFGDRAMGNLGQSNQLATLLLMGMGAYAYIYERRVIGRLGFLFGIVFMTSALVLTQSRAGMLSVVVVSVFLVWKKRSTKSRLPASSVAAWALAFAAGIYFLPYISEWLLLAGVRNVSAAEPISQRLRMWQQITSAIGQSPWLGFGWNQTPTAHAAGAIAFPGSVTYTNAHNVVMDLLAWNGLPLGLLLTGAICYWFITRIWTCTRLDAIHSMACLLPFAVHSMVEYPFAYSYFLIAAGLLAGFIEAARKPAPSISVNLRWAWAFVAFWVPIGGYLSYEYIGIEEDFRVVRFENLRIGKTPDAYEVPHVWLNSHLAAMLRAARQRPEPNMSEGDLNNLYLVSQRFAYGAIHFRYALALALNGDPAGASHRLAIIRGMFGDHYFNACVAAMRQLEAEKYPQLALVPIP